MKTITADILAFHKGVTVIPVEDTTNIYIPNQEMLDYVYRTKICKGQIKLGDTFVGWLSTDKENISAAVCCVVVYKEKDDGCFVNYDAIASCLSTLEAVAHRLPEDSRQIYIPYDIGYKPGIVNRDEAQIRVLIEKIIPGAILVKPKPIKETHLIGWGVYNKEEDYFMS